MDIYAYPRPAGKLVDVPKLRKRFISVFDTKDKRQVAQFGLRYGEHIMNVANAEPCPEVIQAFEAVQEWIDGKVNYHKARNISFRHLYHKSAREGSELKEKRYYRVIGQIACIPHVKAHGLWATDFAISLINHIYPQDLDAVYQEREKQIEFIMRV